MVGDGVFDDLQQLLIRVGGSDGEPMKQLDHQTGEPLECTRNPDRRAHFDQNALGGLDIDLELSGLVDRGVEQGEEALEVRQAKVSAREITRGANAKRLIKPGG